MLLTERKERDGYRKSANTAYFDPYSLPRPLKICVEFTLREACPWSQLPKECPRRCNVCGTILHEYGPETVQKR